MNDLDKVYALVGDLQVLAIASEIAALQQHFDDAGTRGRCTQAGFLHGIGERFFIQRFAGGLHGGEERSVGEALRRAGFFIEYFYVVDGLLLPFFEIGGQDRFGFFFPFCAALALRLAVQNLPAELEDRRAGGAIPIDKFVVGNGGQHNRERDEMIFLPGAEKTAADKVIDLRFVGRKLCLTRRGGRRNDGVVVGNFRVVDKTAIERALAGACDEMLTIGSFDDAYDPGQCAGDVLRQITAVGAGITDQLVTLVKSLREIERSLGGEAEEAIRVALQFGEIVELRRKNTLRFTLNGVNLRLARPSTARRSLWPPYHRRAGVRPSARPRVPQRCYRRVCETRSRRSDSPLWNRLGERWL